jgi:hypothetical protein
LEHYGKKGPVRGRTTDDYSIADEMARGG